MKNFSLWAGIILVGAAAAGAILGAFWTPYDPLGLETGPANSPPSLSHPFGTDWFGRDILSRVLAAAPVGMRVAFSGVVLGGILGTALGAMAGYGGGYPAEALEGIFNLLLSFPPLLLALLLVTTLGPGEVSVVAAIGAYNLPYFGKLARALFLELRGMEYVEAARAVGAGALRIMGRHILPNALGPLLVQFTSSLGMAFLAEASLSYLGLGTQPPFPSWGRMLKEAQAYLSVAPWNAVFPGLAITFTVLGFNLLGDGLGALLNPRLRRS